MKSKTTDKTIVVLPFVNRGANKEEEYFSDGLTEDIINQLSKNANLKVTSRTSAFFFKGKEMTIQEIGIRLNVSLILEGSVRKSGEKVRIATQLINAEDGYYLWSETYNGDLKDIFKVQDKIALAVAEKIREYLGHFEVEVAKERRNENLSNYELYLKSKYNFNKFQKESINLAIEQIEQVITVDSTCSYYFATSALYYCYLPLLNIMPASTAYVLAREFAEKALILDRTDPEANYAIASVAYFFEGDLEKAQKHSYLALKYRPSYPDVLMGVSMV